ncbi:MAG TPA: hypothetical protein PLO41_05110 [Rubrivivax sp.]|nr:hypothetical protein [Rubrivivax sp.]
MEDDHVRFVAAEVPAQLRRAARGNLPALRRVLGAHPQALEEVEGALTAAM